MVSHPPPPLCRFGGEWADGGLTGQTIDAFGKDKVIYTLHEPIGVCGQM